MRDQQTYPAIIRRMAEADWVALGQFVKARREALGLPIVEAAQAAGLGAKWWGQFEAGRRKNVRGYNLGRIARAIDVTLEDLNNALYK